MWIQNRAIFSRVGIGSTRIRKNLVIAGAAYTGSCTKKWGIRLLSTTLLCSNDNMTFEVNKVYTCSTRYLHLTIGGINCRVCKYVFLYFNTPDPVFAGSGSRFFVCPDPAFVEDLKPESKLCRVVDLVS